MCGQYCTITVISTLVDTHLTLPIKYYNESFLSPNFGTPTSFFVVPGILSRIYEIARV